MYNMNYYNTSYLMHHGILGMKWGVRRYQNRDGTLTAAGKRRLKKMGIDPSRVSKGNTSSSSAKKRKTVKTMSDEELKQKTNRLRLETAYRDEKNKAKSTSNTQSTSTGNRQSSNNGDYSAKAMLKNKTINQMTNDELKAYNDRKQLESDYAKWNPKQVSKGQQFAKSAADTVITKIVTPILIDAGKAYVGQKVSNYAKEHGVNYTYKNDKNKNDKNKNDKDKKEK